MGTNGKIAVDRQEVQVYLRDPTLAPTGYGRGWTVRYTTELTNEVDFYVRGEEYSAQLDAWVNRILDNAVSSSGDFTDATITDELLFANSQWLRRRRIHRRVSDDNSVAVQSEQPIGFCVGSHDDCVVRKTGDRVDKWIASYSVTISSSASIPMSEEKARAQAMRFQSPIRSCPY